MFEQSEQALTNKEIVNTDPNTADFFFNRLYLKFSILSRIFFNRLFSVNNSNLPPHAKMKWQISRESDKIWGEGNKPPKRRLVQLDQFYQESPELHY